MEVGFNNDNEAGIRTISGLVDGQKVTSEWNLTEAKNVGRSNATTAKTQAEFEAQAEWTKNVDKDYFVDVNAIDSYVAFKPMLAHDFTKTPVTSGYTQPKLDGIRMVVNTRGLYSRSNKEIVAVPHIAVELEEFIANHPTITLDGELYNHELKDNFIKGFPISEINPFQFIFSFSKAFSTIFSEFFFIKSKSSSSTPFVIAIKSAKELDTTLVK